MSCRAGQALAKQANDAIAYAAGLPSGFPEMPGVGRRGAGRRSGARGGAGAGGTGAAGKGCQRQGPGCKNETCNACADQAVAAIDYAARVAPGQPRVTHADLRAARLAGGFRPVTGRLPAGWTAAVTGAGRDGPVRAAAMDRSPAGPTLCGGDCATKDADEACGHDSSNSKYANGVGEWKSGTGGCERTVWCADYESMCEGTPASENGLCGLTYDDSHPDFNHWVYVRNADGSGFCRRSGTATPRLATGTRRSWARSRRTTTTWATPILPPGR